MNENNKIKRNEKSDFTVVLFEYIIIILNNSFSYLMNYKSMEQLNHFIYTL